MRANARFAGYSVITYGIQSLAFGLLSLFEPSTRTPPAGFQLTSESMPLEEDLIIEKDVALQLRDGEAFYTDIFRPVTDGKVPAIVSWSSYGKSSFTSPCYMNITFTPRD